MIKNQIFIETILINHHQNQYNYIDYNIYQYGKRTHFMLQYKRILLKEEYIY